jgi:PAP2 superfamily
VTAPVVDSDREQTGRRPRLHWYTEALAILAVYLVYTAIRNTFGSATVGPEHAFNNARHVIDFERDLGMFVEEGFQDVFIGHKLFLQFWNVFYGTFHFLVTIFALIWTYRRFPERYPLWRNTIIFTTLLGLIGFALFPLMPPRLLDDCGPFGACASYGFVDTLAVYGGLWSFDSGAMQGLSNQYAAMPSLHFAWSTWCFLVLYRYLPNRPARIAIALYPWLTLFGIVVTANHYWLDAVGGALALAVGYGLARGVQALVTWRRESRSRAAPLPA